MPSPTAAHAFVLLFALVVPSASAADGDPPNEAQMEPTQIHDCWAPRDPGFGLLPPCDPAMLEMREGDGTPTSTISFDSDYLADLCPPWWKFLADGWLACLD